MKLSHGLTFTAISTIAVLSVYKSGVHSRVEQLLIDDIGGYQSRQQASNHLNAIGSCEFEFAMGTTIYRIEGTLASQAPLITITNDRENRAFNMHLGNQKISLPNGDYYGGYPRKLGHHSEVLDAGDAELDRAIRYGLNHFDECQAQQSQTIVAQVPEERATFTNFSPE